MTFWELRQLIENSVQWWTILPLALMAFLVLLAWKGNR